MPSSGVLNELDPKLVASMGGKEKSPEEQAEMEKEMEAERRKRLDDQWQLGKFFLTLGAGIIALGWLNGFVPWHLDFLAQALGLRRFPLPDDIGAFLGAFARKVQAAWIKQASPEL